MPSMVAHISPVMSSRCSWLVSDHDTRPATPSMSRLMKYFMMVTLLREQSLPEWGPLGVRLPLSKQLSADGQCFHAQPFSTCREQSGDGFTGGVCVHTHVLKELVHFHGLFFQWQEGRLDFGDALGVVVVDRGHKEAERPECGAHVEVVRVSRGVGVRVSRSRFHHGQWIPRRVGELVGNPGGSPDSHGLWSGGLAPQFGYRGFLCGPDRNRTHGGLSNVLMEAAAHFQSLLGGLPVGCDAAQARHDIAKGHGVLWNTGKWHVVQRELLPRKQEKPSLLSTGAQWRSVDLGRSIGPLETVSYTHLTLPTI